MEERRGPGAPPGNENHLIHGGERAISDLAAGRPLRGVAVELAQDVARELAEQGAVAVMWQTAIDHLAVSRLFLGLILAEEDLPSLDRWTQRYGWLSSKAFNMLRDLVKIEQDRGDGGTLDYEQLLARQGANGGHSEDR